MLKTKNIFDKKYSYSKVSKNKITKVSLSKRVALGVGLTLAAISSWDLALINTYAIKINDIAEYKVNHYGGLTDYNSFKKQIESVPYSDAQFNYDLKTLDYLYGHKDNLMYRKMISYSNSGYGSFLVSAIVNNFEHKDPHKTYKKLLQETASMPNTKEIPSNLYSFTSRDITPENNKDIARVRMSSLFKLGNSYGSFGPSITINRAIYDNMNTYLKEKGYKEDLLFIDPNLSYNREELTKTKSQSIKYLEEIRYSQDKANAEIEKYYRSGDLVKLKELFKMAHAFTYNIVEQPMSYINKNAPSSNLISSILFDRIYNGSVIYDSAGFISKVKGEYTPEKSVYYENPFGLYY